ncbi:uncharacterized protein LOC143510152 [Brachyhypopomus gauderio]|uniref:uncharacterized protein LOC143510152 n=1 Tax=Brachyhypopomus gauderio TaxID=698409 RepID=UPI0040434905
MLALGIWVLPALCVCAVGKKETGNSNEMKMWWREDPLQQSLDLVYTEIEHLKNQQLIMKQRQDDMKKVMTYCTQTRAYKESDANLTSLQEGSSPVLLPFAQDDEDEDSDSDGHLLPDPCNHYTALDQSWRATNFSTKNVACDRRVNWKGWYRMFYRGKTIQMPEICIKKEMCGTHAPLWLVGGHPRLRDGIVTRKICGHWNNNCCAFKSHPIQVKACRGNYYVYKFVQPMACHLAYCADVNTLVCGRCKKDEICTSRDKINWFCKKSPSRVKSRVHFFASYPGRLSGKVNRIQYRKVYVNVGQAFNRLTGVFTAPVTGVYQFFFSTQTANNGAKTDLWLVVNGYWVAVSHTQVSRSNSVGNLSTYMTSLRKGALVYITHNCGNSWANAASNTITFGGSLLLKRK